MEDSALKTITFPLSEVNRYLVDPGRDFSTNGWEAEEGPSGSNDRYIKTSRKDTK